MMRRSVSAVAFSLLCGVAACGGVPEEDTGTRASFLIGSGTVIHIGDSYSSGVGLFDDASSYDDATCWRDDTATPAARVAALRGGRLINKACIGGRAIDTIPAQFDAALPAGSDGTNTLVVLTAGGNDVKTQRGEEWPDLVRRCILKLSFTGCNREAANQVSNLPQVGSLLDTLYSRIASKAPKASVRVLGYPRMMQPDSTWGCPGVTGIGTGEGRWFDSQVDALNATIAAAVTRARSRTGVDFKFIDVSGYFAGGGACRRWASDRLINDRQGPLSNPSSASFHPSPKGWDAYFRALYAGL
jgi:lysophospholipase L1-like esterase